MKRTATLLGIVAMLVLPVVAVAGDYHNGGTLICSDCHVMHYSQTHGYTAGSGGGIYTPLGGSGPYEYLLRNDINDLCLTCHDGQAFAPDVYASNTGSNIRQAGALNRDGDGNEANGHTLDADDVAPGGTFANANGLNCTDCHQPHGYHPSGNSWRNTASVGGGFISYEIGTFTGTFDILETSPANYDISGVFFEEPDPTASNYAQWCKGCHVDFHGVAGGAEVGGTGSNGTEYHRHPAADADIGANTGGHSNLGVFTGHTNRVKVMSNTGDWSTPGADSTPSCMSCHKAHGNGNAFGLIYMSGTGTVSEEGDANGTQAKDLCKQCHVQG